MKKQTTWLLIVGLLSLLASLGGGLYAYRFYDSLVTTAQVATVARAVPPYTVITPDMVALRAAPRSMLEEPIYQRAEDLIGRMTTVPLYAGQLIYRQHAVTPAAFRYVDDLTAEIVSFSVDPARAVGGQVQIGHRINVYRVRQVVRQASAAAVIPLDGTASAELLAEGIMVVDVRARQGEPANRAIVASQAEQSARTETIKPLQIITVAVDPDTARSLIELSVDEQSKYTLWVTLSPAN